MNMRLHTRADHRRANGYRSKPYAYQNIATNIRQLRWAAGCSLVLSGLFVLSLSLQDSARHPLLIPAAALVASGAAWLLYGVLRMLYVPVAALFCWGGYTAGTLVWGYAAYGYALAGIFAAAGFGAWLMSLLPYRRFGHLSPFTRTQGHILAGADFSLESLAPLADCPHHVTIICKAEIDDSAEMLRELERLLYALSRLCARTGTVLAAFSIDWRANTLTLSLYTPTAQTPPTLLRYLDGIFDNIRYNEEADPTWAIFTGSLLPNETERAEMNNRIIVRSLEKMRFNFQQNIQQMYALTFPDMTTADQFVRQAAQNGYGKPAVLPPLPADASAEQSYTVLVPIYGRVGLQRLNLQTQTLIGLADPLGGKLTDFHIDPAAKQSASHPTLAPEQTHHELAHGVKGDDSSSDKEDAQ